MAAGGEEDHPYPYHLQVEPAMAVRKYFCYEKVLCSGCKTYSFVVYQNLDLLSVPQWSLDIFCPSLGTTALEVMASAMIFISRRLHCPVAKEQNLFAKSQGFSLKWLMPFLV